MGGAVQVHPGLEAVDPTLVFRHFQLLNLKYDKLLSNVGFKCKLRHCGWVVGAGSGGAYANDWTALIASNFVVRRCSLTPGWKQLTPRLVSGTFRF